MLPPAAAELSPLRNDFSGEPLHCGTAVYCRTGKDIPIRTIVHFAWHSTYYHHIHDMLQFPGKCLIHTCRKNPGQAADHLVDLFCRHVKAFERREKFHGAVIAHAGTADTRVFREVTQLGKELEKIGSRVMGSENHAKVGIIFDWENYWALEYTSGPNRDLRYVDQIEQMYNYFYNKNIAVDMIPIDADFSKYDLVAAPVLYMVKDGVAESLEAYVQAGGTLITTYMSGIVGQSDNVHLGGYPGPLRKMAGVWVEEIDALAPEQRNKIRFADGTEEECRLVCDLMHLEGAEEIAQYESDFYAGMTAVAKNQFGKGTVYYVGTDLSESGLAKVLAMAADSAAIQPVIGEATALEITKRQADGEDLYFIINFKDEEIPLPAVFDGKEDILTGEKVQGGEMLKKYGLRIVSVPRA